MSRNRIIYQSEALFSSPSITGLGDTVGNIPSASVINLQRVTDISNSAEITRENVNVFGRLSALSREIIEEPTVSMDFTYFLADGFNESGIGLTTYVGEQEVSAVSGILSNSLDANRNYYILTVDEGLDANNINPTGKAGYGIISLGNCYLSNYTVDASIGEIPTASISIEASNIAFEKSILNSGIQNPSLNVYQASAPRLTGKVILPVATTGDLSLSVIRPGDITIDFSSSSLQQGGAILPGMTSASTSTAAHIQSFSLDLPLSRTPIQKLGSSFAFSRELDVPIDVTLSVTANLADIDEGSLNELICAGSTERDITITLYGNCGQDDNTKSMAYKLKGATLDSQSMSSSIGDSKTVELTFVSQIGGANDVNKGLFISGRSI